VYSRPVFSSLLITIFFVHDRPHAHRGKAALCQIYRAHRSKRLCFEFQHQRYEYIPPAIQNMAELQALVQNGEVFGENVEELGAVVLVRCPVDLTLKYYISAAVCYPFPTHTHSQINFNNKKIIKNHSWFFYSLKSLVISKKGFTIFCNQ
jgi:hypothetical protein